MNVSAIINKMTPEAQKKAEVRAKERGIGLEEYITEVMSSELTDADLDGVAGGLLGTHIHTDDADVDID